VPNNSDTPSEKAPVLGGFFAHEVEKNMEVNITATGYFFGDLQIGSYSALYMEATVENLKIVAVQRVNIQLQKMIREVEEQR